MTDFVATVHSFPGEADPTRSDSDTHLKSFIHLSMILKDDQETAQRIPSDIVMVIDNSGSMNESCRREDNGELSQLTMLDIVKHAVRTVIGTLNEKDRLSLVTFATNAKLVSPLLQMTEENKSLVLEKLASVGPEGSTNLWGGLQLGLDQLVSRKVHEKCRNSACLLLTDGQPTPQLSPKEGHLAALKNYRELNGGKYPAIISTFGFGNYCDSGLLKSLAMEGNGMFSYIPDSGFVGTAFINSLANTLVTFTNDLVVMFEPEDGVEIIPDSELSRQADTRDESWGTRLDIAGMQVGQSLDFILGVRHPRALTSNWVSVRVEYHPCELTGDIDAVEEGGLSPALQIVEVSGPIPHSPLTEQISIYHGFRNKGICKYAEFLELALQRQDVAARQNLETFHSSILSWLDDHLPKDPQFDNVRRMGRGLYEDFSGQAALALSRMDWMLKWGKHYFQSIMRAHSLQQSNNFKDPGIQFYGGLLFKKIQETADDIFNDLPAPLPSRPGLSRQSSGHVSTAATPSFSVSDSRSLTGNYNPTPTPAPAYNINMQTFNDPDAGCIFGECSVMLADLNSSQYLGTKFVKDLKKGDVVLTSLSDKNSTGTIECIVEIKCAPTPIKMIRTREGLVITPWHPIRHTRKTNCLSPWMFPIDFQSGRSGNSIEFVNCDSVYSAVVRSNNIKSESSNEAAIVVNGIECATLGHGEVKDSVLSHPYYSRVVLDDLAKCEGWAKGRIVFEHCCVQRSRLTGMITGFDLEKEAKVDYFE